MNTKIKALNSQLNGIQRIKERIKEEKLIQKEKSPKGLFFVLICKFNIFKKALIVLIPFNKFIKCNS